MNIMAGDTRPGIFGVLANQFVRWADFRRPSDTVVFIDEHEDSIYGGAFPITTPRNSVNAFWGLPGSRHRGAGTLSFADGRVEVHKWVDPRTVKPVERFVPFNGWQMPNNPDAVWIVQHTFFPLN